MKHSRERGFFRDGHGYIVSIRAASRTLDFEMYSEQEDFHKFIRGIKLLITTQDRTRTASYAMV